MTGPAHGRVRHLERIAGTGPCPTCRRSADGGAVPADVERIHRSLQDYLADQESPEWLAA